MEINWFPGHMAKTLRNLKEQISRIDFILEICDARIPASSRNPEFLRVLKGKRRLIILNKADLADENVTKSWIDFFEKQDIPALSMVTKDQKDIQKLRKYTLKLNQSILDKAASKGRRIRPLRVIVCGIPNSGKSTLINALCGKKITVVANKPGVTKSINWVRAGEMFELMDSPGLLWPKLAEREEQIHLAATAAIKENILPIEEVAQALIYELALKYPSYIEKRYNIQLDEILDAKKENIDEQAREIMLAAAKKQSYLKKGGEIDEERFAKRFLDDFRSGKLGRISLEKPEI